jgi:uncharacterized SAM-dependent methyltransferase
VNKELDGKFDLSCFDHRAVYVPEAEKVEMRLVSKCSQWVRIGGLKGSLNFRMGEYIHTEDSHKYRPESFAKMGAEAGLELIDSWKDEDEWFALTLLRKA